jgi:(+)-trans-carveol dehydrogenase
MGVLDGKVALVTGAALGQGRSHARELARAGADVVLVDVCAEDPAAIHPIATSNDLAEAADAVSATGRTALPIEADVTDEAAMEHVVDRTYEQFGRIDVIVANAAVFSVARTWEYSRATWDRVIEVCLTGAWCTTRAAIPRMIEAGLPGSIIMIGSTAATKGIPNMGPYAAAKHGLVGLTKVLAAELGEYDIRVNMVCPTSTNTTMLRNDPTRRIFTGGADDDELFAEAATATHLLQIPWLEPEDISNAVMFFATEASRGCTGSMLNVDAGYTIK